MNTFTPNTEGIFEDLDAATYHAAPGLSNSMMGHMDPPARLPAYLAEKRERTEWSVVGTLVHHLVLEPDKPLPLIAVKPEEINGEAWHGNKKVCKQWIAERESSGEIVIGRDAAATIIGCAQSIQRHKSCAQIFEKGKSEVSIFKRMRVLDLNPTGEGEHVLCKCRMDWVPEIANCLADVKTCQDASEEEFSKTIWEMEYFRQARFYLDIWNATHPDDQREAFVFVAVEKKAPYLVNCFRLDEDAMNRGFTSYSAKITTYNECSKVGKWHGFHQAIHLVGVPDFAKRKMDSK